MSTPRLPLPVKISRLEDGRVIAIQWDEQGHLGEFSARDLRLMCGCAECVEEMSGRPTLDPTRVPADVRVETVRLVGAYAVHFAFTDGHGSGIYPWERLFARCPCFACIARRESAAPADTEA